MRSGSPIRLALVGIGKIARAQHLPALRANPSYALHSGREPARSS